VYSNGLRLWDRLGVYEQIKTLGSSRPNVIMHSMRGTILGEKGFAGAAETQTGYGYMRIKRTDILDVLLDAAAKAGIPIHYDKRITSIEESGQEVRIGFSDGSEDSAEFLLGCDGIHSAVRRLYVDPGVVPEYTGLAGLGGFVSSSDLSQNARDSITGFDVTMTQEGMFAVTPCTASGNELTWMFQRETPLPAAGDVKDGWEVRQKEQVEGFQATILDLVKDCQGDWSNTMREVIKSARVVKLYPIHKLPLGGKWSRGRVLLLGDAAHAMPPHAGQGIGMAMEDAFLLARVLARRDDFASVESMFGRYEDIRRPRVDRISAHASDNGKMRRKVGPLGLWMKEIGIYLYTRGASALGLAAWGATDKQLVYDIEDEKV
jgi:2-polyprenyl-6-methoxyphenol hydroxylase-like FAD-dependent oxidoreductase